MQRLLGLAVVLAAFGCHSPVGLASGRLSGSPAASDAIRVDGAVHFYDLEGGFWAIRGDDGTTYDPLDALPAEFQAEGLRVRLEAKLRPDLASVHMVGPIVEIISLERI
jgi:hypothetical protein